jgi:hypothetical protein
MQRVRLVRLAKRARANAIAALSKRATRRAVGAECSSHAPTSSSWLAAARRSVGGRSGAHSATCTVPNAEVKAINRIQSHNRMADRPLRWQCLWLRRIQWAATGTATVRSAVSTSGSSTHSAAVRHCVGQPNRTERSGSLSRVFIRAPTWQSACS